MNLFSKLIIKLIRRGYAKHIFDEDCIEVLTPNGAMYFSVKLMDDYPFMRYNRLKRICKKHVNRFEDYLHNVNGPALFYYPYLGYPGLANTMVKFYYIMGTHYQFKADYEQAKKIYSFSKAMQEL